ncbi:MAG: S41 family peptidase, partial [Patescibacteria group bacterium]
VCGAISGMVAAAGDPYTVFLPPEEKRQFEEDISGNFSGVGMEVGVKDGLLTVVSPLPGSPAKLAGIKAGDKIIEINGEVAAEMTVDKAIGKIRGPEGTKVVLTLITPDTSSAGQLPSPHQITVTRAVIEIPTIDTELRPDGIFVIRLYNFSANSPELFRQSLQKFSASKSNKLILDLRGNPGGYLEAAVDMASYFLPKGQVIVWEHQGADAQDVAYRSKGYDVFADNLKMVILVDKGSASASEILAGALAEYDIATLVGETTFGKGSVQELVPVTADTSLKVTIARWLTPKGVSISKAGLKPDIEVKMTLEEYTAGKDPQFDKAIEILKK